MTRLTIIVIYLTSIFAFNFVCSDTWGNIDTKLEISNLIANINATTQKNFTKTVEEVKIFTKDEVKDGNLTASISSRSLLQPRIEVPRTTITHKLGKRVNGDRLVASTSSNQQWTVSQNVTQNLSYPKTGVGAVITYVEIIVEQSSRLGKSYVTTGGINQRQISITVESERTLIFHQITQIYGY